MINNQAQMQREAIRRSNKPLNKYSEAVHQNTEALTDEVSDRTAADIGMEMEIKNNQD